MNFTPSRKQIANRMWELMRQDPVNVFTMPECRGANKFYVKCTCTSHHNDATQTVCAVCAC